jgi:hypothetical protein
MSVMNKKAEGYFVMSPDMPAPGEATSTGDARQDAPAPESKVAPEQTPPSRTDEAGPGDTQRETAAAPEAGDTGDSAPGAYTAPEPELTADERLIAALSNPSLTAEERGVLREHITLRRQHREFVEKTTAEREKEAARIAALEATQAEIQRQTPAIQERLRLADQTEYRETVHGLRESYEQWYEGETAKWDSAVVAALRAGDPPPPRPAYQREQWVSEKTEPMRQKLAEAALIDRVGANLEQRLARRQATQVEVLTTASQEKANADAERKLRAEIAALKNPILDDAELQDAIVYKWEKGGRVATAQQLTGHLTSLVKQGADLKLATAAERSRAAGYHPRSAGAKRGVTAAAPKKHPEEAFADALKSLAMDSR